VCLVLKKICEETQREIDERERGEKQR
jgi:hypothetical protein